MYHKFHLQIITAKNVDSIFCTTNSTFSYDPKIPRALGVLSSFLHCAWTPDPHLLSVYNDEFNA
jgi:hypothetical protein